MNKLLMVATLALATATTANAFTQDQQRDLELNTVKAECINPVTNVKMTYTGTKNSVYISTSSGLLVIRLPNRAITLAPHYCVIEGYK